MNRQAGCASWVFFSEQKEGHFWNQHEGRRNLRKLTHPSVHHTFLNLLSKVYLEQIGFKRRSFQVNLCSRKGISRRQCVVVGSKIMYQGLKKHLSFFSYEAHGNEMAGETHWAGKQVFPKSMYEKTQLAEEKKI